MKPTTSYILLTSFFLPFTSFALPTATTPAALTPRDGNTYFLSGYGQGCTPHGCDYFFDITFPGNSQEPAFTTTCRGSSYISGPQACVNAAVSSSQVQGTNAVVTVQHVFTQDLGENGSGGKASYWVQGQATVTNDWRAMPLSFQIQESEFRAVA